MVTDWLTYITTYWGCFRSKKLEKRQTFRSRFLSKSLFLWVFLLMWPAAVSMQCINMLVSTQWLWLSETYQSTQEKSLPGHRLASTPAESAQVGWQLSLINLEMVSCYHRQFSTFPTFKQLDSLQTNEKKSNWEKFPERYKNGNISFLNALVTRVHWIYDNIWI